MFANVAVKIFVLLTTWHFSTWPVNLHYASASLPRICFGDYVLWQTGTDMLQLPSGIKYTFGEAAMTSRGHATTSTASAQVTVWRCCLLTLPGKRHARKNDIIRWRLLVYHSETGMWVVWVRKTYQHALRCNLGCYAIEEGFVVGQAQGFCFFS